MHYNTTRLVGQEYANALCAAEAQEDRVHVLFQHYGALTPSVALEAYRVACHRDTPLTSIRRAISDLTDQGKLEKTDVQAVGTYGKREHVWRLA